MIEISFIVAVYNMERYLEKCLDSIINQIYHNYEVVIVDDCSTDGSVAIIREYETKYSKVCKVVRNENNLGLGSSRYVGMSVAQGEYLVYVDADDWIDETFSQKIHEKIQQQRYDMIYAAWDYVKEDGNCIVEYYYLPYLEGEMTENKRQALFYYNNVQIWGAAYNKKFLEKWPYCFISGQNYDEDVISLLYPLMIQNLGIINEKMYHWLKREASMSNEAVSHYRDRLRVGCYFFKSAERMGLLEKYTTEIEYGIAMYYYLGMIKAASDAKEYAEFPLELLKKASIIMKKFFPDYQKNKYLIEKESKNNLMLAKANDQSPEKFVEQYYSQYADDYITHADDIKKIMSYCERKRYSVAIWGAGKKGRTFLHFCDPEGTWIKYVLDRNQSLWGKKLGANHTIYNFDNLKEKIDIIIVMDTKHYLSIYKKASGYIQLIDLDYYIKYGVSFEEL